MSVALKKMPGVESVEARLNEGKAVVRLKPGNTISFGDLVKAVRDKAFTPKEARVNVRGELVSSSGKLHLHVSGTNERYDLVAGPDTAELMKSVGKTVLIEGVIPAPKNKNDLRVMEVKSLTPAS